MKHILIVFFFMLGGCASWMEKPEGPVTAAVVIGASVGSHMLDICRHYPCAHAGHLGLGALVGYEGAKHYDEATAWKWGAIFAFGKEVFDVLIGKPFGLFDALQRLAGVAIGVRMAQPDNPVEERASDEHPRPIATGY